MPLIKRGAISSILSSFKFRVCFFELCRIALLQVSPTWRAARTSWWQAPTTHSTTPPSTLQVSACRLRESVPEVAPSGLRAFFEQRSRSPLEWAFLSKVYFPKARVSIFARCLRKDFQLQCRDNRSWAPWHRDWRCKGGAFRVLFLKSSIS